MTTKPSFISRRSALALASLATLLAACASHPLDAQWSDTQLVVNKPLQGARVLVVCESQDEVLRRVCQDAVSAELRTSGAVPVSAPDVGTTTSAPGGPAPYVAAARTANAKAVFVTSVAPGASVARPGMSIGVGLGGFGGGGFGGGVGVSAPIGGGRIDTSLAANTSVTDVATGRLMWTARASTAPSRDVSSQTNELARKVVAGAKQAGVL